MIDFLFVIIELFRYVVRLRHYKTKSAFFEGCGPHSFWRIIWVEVEIPSNPRRSGKLEISLFRIMRRNSQNNYSVL